MAPGAAVPRGRNPVSRLRETHVCAYDGIRKLIPQPISDKLHAKPQFYVCVGGGGGERPRLCGHRNVVVDGGRTGIALSEIDSAGASKSRRWRQVVPGACDRDSVSGRKPPVVLNL